MLKVVWFFILSNLLCMSILFATAFNKYGTNKESIQNESFNIASYHKIKDGENLLFILQKLGIPESIYYEQNAEIRESVEEIKPNFSYYVLRDNTSKEIQQVLVQINSELQFHIYRENEKFMAKMTPIEYTYKIEQIAIKIENSIYEDFVSYDKSFATLAEELRSAFNKSVDFKKVLRKNDTLSLIYEDRYRLGINMESPRILASKLDTFRKNYYVFYNPKDERYYDEKAVMLEGFFLKSPLRSYRRISSKFSRKRFHPIKKVYRAHHGVDYSARTGTRVYAARKGKIIHVGRRGGYGKTIIIRHQYGYKTLYAHLSRYAKGLRVGKYVNKGKYIGKVGNTGLSTGPHLHFGLYKKNRAINPLGLVRLRKKKLRGKTLKEFKIYTAKYKKQMQDLKSTLNIYANASNESQNTNVVVDTL